MEAVVAYFYKLPQHLPEKIKIICKVSQRSGRDSEAEIQEYNSKR